jgi:hypothetical protein
MLVDRQDFVHNALILSTSCNGLMASTFQIFSGSQYLFRLVSFSIFYVTSFCRKSFSTYCPPFFPKKKGHIDRRVYHIPHLHRPSVSSAWRTLNWLMYGRGINWLTPWSRIPLEKLELAQLVNQFPASYETRRFTIALTMPSCPYPEPNTSGLHPDVILF